MRNAAAAGALAVVAVLILGGCSTTAGAGDTVVTAYGTEPAAPLIPANTVELGGARVVDSIFAGLVTYDADGVPVNELAESIESNPARTVFTIEVRNDQTFTNGDRVDAEAFVRAWDWVADSANESAGQHYFRDLKGYLRDNPDTPEVERSSLIETGGLVIVDPYTFEIHLTSSLADFPQRLGVRAFYPLPSAFFEDPEEFGEHPIGNGPYMLDGPGAWQHDERIDLVLNPGYVGPRSPVNGGVSLVFYTSPETAYVDMLAGFLDVLDTLPASALPTVEDELGARSIDQPGDDLVLLTIPTGIPHLGGPEGLLRRAAIATAINRDFITGVMLDGRQIPSTDFTTQVVQGWSDDIAGSDVLSDSKDDDADAAALWAEADALRPWEGTFPVAYTDPADREWVEEIAGSIGRVLKIDAVAVPYETPEDLTAALADKSTTTPFISKRSAQYPGLLSYLGQSFMTKAAGNFGKYTSKDYDALIRSGNVTEDLTERNSDYLAAQRVLMIDLPAIPLWSSTVQAGYADSVEGVTLDWQGVPQFFRVAKT